MNCCSMRGCYHTPKFSIAAIFTRTDSPSTTLKCPNYCKNCSSVAIKRSRKPNVSKYSVVVEDEHQLYTCSVDFQRKNKGKDERKMKEQITTRYKPKSYKIIITTQDKLVWHSRPLSFLLGRKQSATPD